MQPYRFVVAILGLLASALAVAGGAHQAAHAAPYTTDYCGYDGHPGLATYRWTGAASRAWHDPRNWTRDGVPLTADQQAPGGNSSDPGTTYETDYVCIPAGSDVILRGGTDSNVQVNRLDVEGNPASSTTVRVLAGATLRVFGDPSRIRPGATLVVSGGRYGGPGDTLVGGAVVARTGQGARSAFTMRSCNTESCDAVPAQRGYLVIRNHGRLLLDRGGVHLQDFYRIRVHGRARIGGTGYLVADHGTRVELQPQAGRGSRVGTLEIAGDGGIYEGYAPTNYDGPFEWVNNGRVVKTSGRGTSVLAASSSGSQSTPVEVRAGTLLLSGVTDHAVRVAGGARYGTGTCVWDGFRCAPETDPLPPLHRQSASLRVPRADRDGARVRVDELAATDSALPSGVVGDPFVIRARGLRATADRPAIVAMRYDSDLLTGQTPATMQVLLRPAGEASYRTVRTCRPDGSLPRRALACVDRRDTPRSSRWVPEDSDDLVMVVRTRATGRWAVR